MGVKELRDSFNLVAEPDASARKAFLSYKMLGLTQYQVLTFQGSFADGAPFEVKSTEIRPGGDAIIAARDTAKTLLAQRGIER